MYGYNDTDDLKRRQQEHLNEVANRRYNIPCMHDSCANCVGTGVGKDGRPCVHAISCPCVKCSPR